jgi:hypothetical protein
LAGARSRRVEAVDRGCGGGCLGREVRPPCAPQGGGGSRFLLRQNPRLRRGIFLVAGMRKNSGTGENRRGRVCGRG